MSALDLARIQFAFTAAFHFIFPAVTIGLGLLVAVAETIRWRTGSEVWDRLARFWLKVFAVTFAVGVATGIVMEFQFGTNWSRYSTFVGDIFGSPLAAEAIFAFFLESTFLGVLLWGGTRVGSTLRWFSAVMVAFGAALSGSVDHHRQLVDADAGGLRSGRRSGRPDRFLGGGVQPLHPAPLSAHDFCGDRRRVVPDGRHGGLLRAQGTSSRRRPPLAAAGPGRRGRRLGGHVPDRRYALPPGGQYPAGQVRRDERALRDE